jgi:FKBP-type peptidyl-prolyl cis-trans isomerase
MKLRRSICLTLLLTSLAAAAEGDVGPSLNEVTRDQEPAAIPVSAVDATPIENAGESGEPGLVPVSGNVWQSLFNGNDLEGWVVQDGLAESWSVQEGAIVCDKVGGGWLRTTDEFSDYELTLEYRLTPGANTGLGFRFPAGSNPTSTGFEVQLLDDAAPKYAGLRPDQQTGSLYYHCPPTTVSAAAANEWHRLRVVACGSHLTVEVNDKLVNEVWVESLAGTAEARHPLRSRPHRGPIAMQSSSQRIDFRNLQVRSLLRSSPQGLQVVDLRSGAGELCNPGATVQVDYVGRFEDGTWFDGTETFGEPIVVQLENAIEGWQLGLPGMKVGGRRKLIVPAALAYGADGVPDRIPGGATLVFEVELRGIEH